MTHLSRVALVMLLSTAVSPASAAQEFELADTGFICNERLSGCCGYAGTLWMGCDGFECVRKKKCVGPPQCSNGYYCCAASGDYQICFIVAYCDGECDEFFNDCVVNSSGVFERYQPLSCGCICAMPD